MTDRGRRDSAAMLMGLGILAYAASTMAHEALGHGVACVAVGGHNVAMTAWQERCTFQSASVWVIKLAGPATQFGTGLVAWLLLQLVPCRAIRMRLFLWLFMSFDLLIASGYVLFSGVTNYGDAAELIATLRPAAMWRAGLVAVGGVLYTLSMGAAAVELRRFARTEDGQGRLYRLVWLPYVAAGVFACGTAALNRTMEPGAALAMAATSSLGAGSGLFALPAMQRAMGPTSRVVGTRITWSASWGLVAGAVIALFVFFLGPGVR